MNSAAPLKTENEWCGLTLRRVCSSRGRREESGSTTGNRERMTSTHSSSCVLFTGSPERIRQHHWKQRTNNVDSLFVVCALHEVAGKNSAAPLETENEWCGPTIRRFYSSRGRQEGFGSTTGNRERMTSTHSLFFTKFAENTLEGTREKGNSIGVLFVVCALHEVVRKNSATPLETKNEWCRHSLRRFYSS